MGIVILICVVFLICLPIAARLVREARRRAGAQRVNSLYRAATVTDPNELRQTLERLGSVDLRDSQGNTALHLAYYEASEQAVANLIAYGADDNLRNREGLSPPEMADVRAAELLLRQAAACLRPGGVWDDRERGSELYHQLKRIRPRIYNPALVRLVLKHPERRTLLCLAIKLGVPGSELKLGEVLTAYGTREMAVDYLNAGSRPLTEAAERWARRHGYRIHYLSGRTSVIWGRF